MSDTLTATGADTCLTARAAPRRVPIAIRRPVSLVPIKYLQFLIIKQRPENWLPRPKSGSLAVIGVGGEDDLYFAAAD